MKHVLGQSPSHDHSPGCDCQVTEFDLDHQALGEYAKTLGIEHPVVFEYGNVRQEALKVETGDRIVTGLYAGRWDIEWRWLVWPVRRFKHHRIAVQQGLPAGETCAIIRHELQHAVQAERGNRTELPQASSASFDRYWNDPLEVEAREVMEREWRDVGPCLLAKVVDDA